MLLDMMSPNGTLYGHNSSLPSKVVLKFVIRRVHGTGGAAPRLHQRESATLQDKQQD